MELIRLIENDGQKAVSMRELHEFLEVQTHFKDWSKRMLEYGFVENRDFQAIAQKRATAQGNQTTYNDYALSLDCAKEISMIQRSEKGKQAREYFLDCEKKLYSAKPMTQLDILRAALDQIEAHERKQKEMDNRLLIVESKQETINEEYFAISGYYRLRGMRFNLTNQQAQIFGKRATSVSKDLGYTVGKAYHEKYGSVSTYHVDVLKVILGF